jgi:hypothetical protein
MKRQYFKGPVTKELVLELASKWYDKFGVGGFLHIVLDDGNLEDDDIKWCIKKGWKLAVFKEHLTTDDRWEGVALGEALLELSMEDREWIYERYDEYAF